MDRARMLPATLAVWALSLAAACGEPERAGPNVLLISVDMLRPDHLSCYGYHRPTSPSIDRLAAEGVLFETHVSSSSWTLPAHAALFTSLADSVHGCVDVRSTALAPQHVTLAERFRAAGYATGGFFSGPYLHSAFGLDQGFQDWVDCTGYAEELNAPKERWMFRRDVMLASHADVTSERVYEASRSWIERRRGRSFFAFLHLWDVHFDFVPPPPYDTLFDPDYEGTLTGRDFWFDDRQYGPHISERDLEHLLALYDGEIRWTDSFIGKLLDDLDAWDLSEDTIVVVTSDHGTEFFEHGGRAHRKTLFDEAIRIPLVLRFPGHLPAGDRVQAQTRIADLGPTLLELAGLPPAEDVMGHSLVALARGEPLAFDNTALSELWADHTELRAVRTREGKLIEELRRGQLAWFDLAEDPGELRPRRDLSGGLGSALAELALRQVEQLERALAAHPGAAVEPALERALLERLGQLGYTGGEEGEDGR